MSRLRMEATAAEVTYLVSLTMVPMMRVVMAALPVTVMGVPATMAVPGVGVVPATGVASPVRMMVLNTAPVKETVARQASPVVPMIPSVSRARRPGRNDNGGIRGRIKVKATTARRRLLAEDEHAETQDANAKSTNVHTNSFTL